MSTNVVHRPVTTLGHQWGQRVFWEWPTFFKLFKLCPTHFFWWASPPGYGPGSTAHIIWNHQKWHRFEIIGIAL